MIYVWDLIQNDPTESGTKNGWSLSKIRSALSQGLCGPGDGCLGMQVGGGKLLFSLLECIYKYYFNNKKKLKKRAGEKEAKEAELRQNLRVSQVEKEDGQHSPVNHIHAPPHAVQPRPCSCCVSPWTCCRYFLLVYHSQDSSLR